ncbi:uncharacterized protein LOC135690833 [Rhopilema esculentum]|uniref:uncharacterized protein LOC135690833 n=1 Tax=Rhopilema esculentum TaxID=499914 RepID=UPI0031E11F95|eukprot:gene1026-15352_t
MADHSMHETAENSFENILEKESQPSKDEHVFDFVDVVNGFSKLFTVNPSYQLDELENIIESLLIYCGECCALTDQIREESKKLLFAALPEFYEKRAAMQSIFKQIDCLEEFISVIKANVEQLEESVQLGEKELGNKNLKKFMSSIPIPSFFAQKKQARSHQKAEVKDTDPQIPQIFKVDDYIETDDSES